MLQSEDAACKIGKWSKMDDMVLKNPIFGCVIWISGVEWYMHVVSGSIATPFVVKGSER